jgi:hypothetical protein
MSSKEEKINSFNPNSAGVADSQMFGLPFTIDESEIVLLPVPWEVTVSYGGGASEGPEHIFESSLQVDLHHPEFVHKGVLGFGSSIPPSNVRTIPFPDRVGLEFDYHIKSNIRYISREMNISHRDKYTKNFNMFIEPTIAWSKVSIDNGNKNLIIYVDMLPIKQDVTRWFVSMHHNFNNDNIFQKYVLKTATRLILSQDYKQFKKMYPDNLLKEVSTFQFMLKHDEPIEYIKEILQNYTYPDVKYCADFVKLTRKF